MKKILKLIMAIIGLLMAAAAGSAATLKSLKSSSGSSNKFQLYYNTLNQWLMLKNSGKKVEEYFINNNYQTVAIYGMGELGNRLYEELNQSDNVKISYAIDKNFGYLYEGDLEIVLPEDELKPVDVIVVTAIFDFDSIYDKLQQQTDSFVVSLEEVVFEV